jgi:glycerol-3-phosphate dehydrogenase
MNAYQHYLQLTLDEASDPGSDPQTLGRHLLALAICLERTSVRQPPDVLERRTRIAFQLRILAHEAKRIANAAHDKEFRARVTDLVTTTTSF